MPSYLDHSSPSQYTHQSRYREEESCYQRQPRQRYNDDTARREVYRADYETPYPQLGLGPSEPIRRPERKDHRNNEGFSPGYRAEVEPLPPLEERVGPDGLHHRIYPAPAEISPPTNIDQGWSTPGHSLHESLARIDLNSKQRASPERTPPGSAIVTPIFHDAARPAETMAPQKTQGAYIPWVGVEYSDPSINREDPVTREEMLEVLAGMRRNRESRNETADPCRADYASKAEDGWMSRKIGPRDASPASGWESVREEAGGFRSDARAAPEDNLSRKGYQSIDQTPPYSQAAADDDGWGKPVSQQQATSQSGNRTDTPRSISGIHPDRLRLMGLSVPSSPARTKHNEFHGHTEVASPEIRHERQWTPDKTSANPVQSLDQNPQAQDCPGDTRPRHHGDTRSSSGRTPRADREVQSDSHCQSLSENWGAPGGAKLPSGDRLQGQGQGHSDFNQASRHRQGPMFQSQERQFGYQQGHLEGDLDRRRNDKRVASDQDRENRWGQALPTAQHLVNGNSNVDSGGW